MAGDYSRKIFNSKKHYSGVQMQQGRVQLDADWNEQLDIQLYRTHTEATDVIGVSGVPKKDGGFEIALSSNKDNLTISPGRIYVGGLLCELEFDQEATYTVQPYYPNPEYVGSGKLILDTGTYLVFIEAWQREITALDDKLIREVALGGPDTTTRLQTVWQVRLLQLPETSPPTPAACDAPIAAFEDYTTPATGMMNARTNPPQNQTDPCLLPPTAGYQRLENQLYRVEVQTGGPRSTATFKWSRDNATVESTIEKIDGDTITVSDLGKDDVLGFANEQWVEIVDDETELNGSPRQLLEIASINSKTREVTMITTVAGLKGTKLRRWDQRGDYADGVSMDLAQLELDQWIELEGGVQVSFSAGDYRAGDYWLIPARTATADIEWPPYEIPNKSPIKQPPVGVKHYYCRLALIQAANGAAVSIEDCRKKFPALTEICAEDVCYDNTTCDLPDAENVQEALDALCKARDLRWHNKYLHGWGIVGGLQVVCGTQDSDNPDPDRRFVTVKSGYAIDCEGNDIIKEDNKAIDVVALVNELDPTTTTEGSTYSASLYIDPADASYRIEKYDPTLNTGASIFDGTIWKDVYEDCIKNLITSLKEDVFVESVPGALVTSQQKLLTTLMNLYAQLLDTVNGPHIYLSGSNDKEYKESEDYLLRNLYETLRTHLVSNTLCGMAESESKYPAYPFPDNGIRTIFGAGLPDFMRVDPKGALAYCFGWDSKIYVYDLITKQMTSSFSISPGTNEQETNSAIVKDIAFSADSRYIYATVAVTSTSNNQTFHSTYFAKVGTSGENPIVSKEPICDAELIKLAVYSGPDFERVYAIATGEKGGLYELTPGNVNTHAQPVYSCYAYEHLVIDNGYGLAYISAFCQYVDANKDTQTEPCVHSIDLKTLGSTSPATPVIYKFRDPADVPAEVYILDICAPHEIAGNKGELVYPSLHVATAPRNTGNNKLWIFDPDYPAHLAIVDLLDNSPVRLCYNDQTRYMMVAYENSYFLRLVKRDQKGLDITYVLDEDYQHPLQMLPTAIAIAPDPNGANTRMVYALNSSSNTITSIPASLLSPEKQLSIKALEGYRTEAMAALNGLTVNLAQYLKDCFCEHLLVNEPVCDDKQKKIYLACITLDTGEDDKLKVYKICNFSLRKYVRTFPTVEYWLSVVPIAPIITKAVEMFCCAELDGTYMEMAWAAVLEWANNKGSEQSVRTVQTAAKNISRFSFQSMFNEFAHRLNIGGRVSSDWLSTERPGAKQAPSRGVQRPGAKQAPSRGVHRNEFLGMTVKAASARLTKNNVSIAGVEEYDPNNVVANAMRFTTAPNRLEPGSHVTLIEENGIVRYYTTTRETPVEVFKLEEQLQQSKSTADEALALKDKVGALEGELARTRKANEAALAQRDAEIAKLKTATAKIEANMQSFNELSKKIEAMSKTRASRKKREPKDETAK